MTANEPSACVGTLEKQAVVPPNCHCTLEVLSILREKTTDYFKRKLNLTSVSPTVLALPHSSSEKPKRHCFHVSTGKYEAPAAWCHAGHWMLPEDMVPVLDKPALLGEERVQRQSKPTQREPVPRRAARRCERCACVGLESGRKERREEPWSPVCKGVRSCRGRCGNGTARSDSILPATKVRKDRCVRGLPENGVAEQRVHERPPGEE